MGRVIGGWSAVKLVGAFALALTGLSPPALGAEPAAAPQAPAPLASYGQLPAFEMAAMSPSGDHVAAVGVVKDARSIVVITRTGEPLMSVPVGEAKVRDLTWAGDDAVLLSYSTTVALDGFSVSRAELGSVVVVPITPGAKPYRVFANERSITGGVWGRYGVVRIEGDWYGYFGGITMQHPATGVEYRLSSGRLRPDLYRVRLKTGGAIRIAERANADTVSRDWLVDASGKVGAYLDYAAGNGRWTLYDGKGRGLTEGSAPLGEVGIVGFSPDGLSVVVERRDAAAKRDDWIAVPLKGGTQTPFLQGANVRQIYRDGGHRLLGYLEDNATGTAHFFSPLHDKIYKATLRAFPGRVVTLKDADEKFTRLVVTTEGGGDPLVWWSVDIASGSADVIGTSYPIAAGQVGPFRMVPYKAADGLAMEGLLTLPPDRPERALPAVVLPHGGPAAHDVAGFDWIAQAFASRGYAVFQPNFRGSTGYGASFEMAGRGEWGRKMQTDVSDGLAELVRQGIVDPKRVCILGASYGGYAALAGVTLQQDIYHCAVSIAGVSDLAAMISDKVSDSGGEPLLRRWLRENVGDRADLGPISPVRFADKVTVPVMLIHGKDDTVVKPLQSRLMANALRKAGKGVEYVILPGEDHWLSRGATRQAMLEAAVGFVTRNNPP